MVATAPIVVLGASGNVGSKIGAGLLARGEPVRAVGRRGPALEPLRKMGAEGRVGDLRDTSWLVRTLQGARAAFLMLPPAYADSDPLAAQAAVGKSVADAARSAGLRRVVFLSSLGADVAAGTGPIVALHQQEKRLEAALPGADVVHLRAGFFMENVLPYVDVVQGLGFLPGQVEPASPLEMVATQDDAGEAITAILDPRPRGASVVSAIGPATQTMRDAARALGDALGRPGLAYVRVPDADAEAAGLKAGFSATTAALFTEMARFLSSGGAKPTGDVRRGLTALPKFLAGRNLPRLA